MSLTCYIIDDEPLAIEVIESHVRKYGALDVLQTFQNAIKAFRALSSRSVDLIFLDIEMPGLTGLELLRSLTNPPHVILTTAHRAYAVEGFELDVVDYLVKPISFERFLKAMAKVEERIVDPKASAHPATAGRTSIVVRVAGKNVRVPLSDIEYVESRRDYVHIVTPGGIIRAPYKISDLAEELRPSGFLRIHRSFIVPENKIDAWSTTEVKVGKTSLPIGRTYRSQVKRRLDDHGP